MIVQFTIYDYDNSNKRMTVAYEDVEDIIFHHGFVEIRIEDPKPEDPNFLDKKYRTMSKYFPASKIIRMKSWEEPEEINEQNMEE